MTSSPVPQPSPAPRLALPRGRVVAGVAAVIAVATVAVVVALWWAGTAGLTGPELVKARFDALRTGLSIGIGGGGAFALYLAWRRQRSTEIGLQQKERDQADVARAYALQERVAATTEADATARRITELYAKSAEQLGSDKAPVRLAGLYALERLAQDNPAQRQTIVYVVCSYLRMPYDPDGQDAAQERQVRVTAQRVVSTHLRPFMGDRFWPDIDLDLTGAVLIDYILTDTRLRSGRFADATFIGVARFNRATFTASARFGGASFTARTDFDGARFESRAVFDGATFAEPPDFTTATFAEGPPDTHR